MALSYLPKILINTGKCYGLSALLAFGILLIVPFFINWITLYFLGGILFIMPILVPFVRNWMPKDRTSPEGKAVFISGCDSGFGSMLAQRLDDIGFHVFAGCLFPEGDGATNLRKSGSQRLHVFGLDVRSNSSVADAAAYVEENLKGNVLWAVVNNAGIAAVAEIDWQSMDSIENITEVNLLGVVRVTKAFLPKLKESKGKILTVASLAGHTPIPALVPYCMTKAAVINFCEGLRLELYKWGIQVIIFEPSFHRTAIASREGVTKSSKELWESVSKEVKDLYGPKYIENLIKNIIFLCKQNIMDPSDVISAMQDAIMDLYPQYSYAPGSFIHHFASWCGKKLPRPITDLLTLFMVHGKKLK